MFAAVEVMAPETRTIFVMIRMMAMILTIRDVHLYKKHLPQAPRSRHIPRIPVKMKKLESILTILAQLSATHSSIYLL